MLFTRFVLVRRWWQGSCQHSNNPTCQMLLDFTMPWNRLCNPRYWISIPIVFSTMSNEFTTELLNRFDEIDAFHAMTISPTFLTPGM